MELEIKLLSPDLIDDFLYFFDEIGFADNPDWADCYCHFYHFKGSRKEWTKSTKEQNRNASKSMILSGDMQGFLAYLEGRPIGWCNANSKNNYQYQIYKEPVKTEGKIASIVCFLISYQHRKKGIAKLLLKYTCQYFQQKDYDYIESYPRKNTKSDAYNYHGTYTMYQSEGFYVEKELKHSFVMRKRLKN
ncbi:MAG: GNAT family N-acetyltransferase [Promethearchaeota archaeon]